MVETRVEFYEELCDSVATTLILGSFSNFEFDCGALLFLAELVLDSAGFAH